MKKPTKDEWIAIVVIIAACVEIVWYYVNYL